MKVYMQKILISSIILFLFCSLFSEDLGTVCKQKQEKILQLEQNIEENLRDTTVLNLFLEEKENWNKYMQSRINLLFPEEIDGVKMLWGSIESHEVTVEMIKLLDFRIQMLDNYLAREEGTDGEGKFKEYVEEIRRIKN